MVVSCGEPAPTARELELAAVEGRWQCEVGRRAFESLEAIETARLEVWATNGVSPEEAEAFLAQLPSRSRLRAAVREAYAAHCDPGE